MQISRERIIVGAATRLDIITHDTEQDLNDIDPDAESIESRIIRLGSTIGDVIVRRESEYLDITNNLGTVIDKMRTTDKFFIELNLAESQLETLNEIWDKQTITTSTNPEDGIEYETREFTLTTPESQETARTLVIEGPGVIREHRGTPTPIAGSNPPMQHTPIYKRITTRRYQFNRTVSITSSQQAMQRGAATSIPITFEVLRDTSHNTASDTTKTINFGKVKEIETRQYLERTIEEGAE